MDDPTSLKSKFHMMLEKDGVRGKDICTQKRGLTISEVASGNAFKLKKLATARSYKQSRTL